MTKVLGRWRLWLGVLVSVAFLYLAFRGQDLGGIGEKIRAANYWWLVPAVAAYFLAVGLRALRWQVFLGPVKGIPATRLFPLVAIGYAGNNIFPLRAGEFLRALLLRRKEAVSASTALATILVERIFDGLTMVAFALFGLGFVALSPAIRRLLAFTGILFVGALVAFFLVASSSERVVQLSGWVVARLVPARFRGGAMRILERFLEGFRVLRSGRQVLAGFGLSVALWLLEALKYYFIMEGFAFHVGFYGMMLTTAVVNLANILPATPGYLGTFEAAGIASLALLGVSRADAASFMVVLHAAIYFPVTILGLAFMWLEGLSWVEVGKLREQGGEETCASG